MAWRGGMAEWTNAAVLKTAIPARVSWVRIPLPPPFPAHNGLLHSILSTWFQTISGAWVIRFDRLFDRLLVWLLSIGACPNLPFRTQHLPTKHPSRPPGRGASG
jgi:hypothetical protein